ncbi:MAG: VWA domain-containing protein [Spirochaeta sp.]
MRIQSCRARTALFVSVLVYLQFLSADPAFGLELGPDDVRIEESLDGGFYLYIRASDAIGSVLVVESTEHPERAAASYALRDPGDHPANRGERRLLDGEVLEETRGQSLVSSTVYPDDEFDNAFRIFVPYITVYGYPWTRSGEIEIRDGTYINLRTFELPYADYRGEFQDNPFRIRVAQRTVQEQTTPPIEDGPLMPLAVDAFSEVAAKSGTVFRAAETPEELTSELQDVIDSLPPTDIDIVLVLDTTQSMYPYMPELQKTLVPMLQETGDEESSRRIGVVFFRDYLEEFVVRQYPFTEDFQTVQNYIDRAVARGGRDIPEAVHEGLYAALEGYEWRGLERRIVLVGDAPPHPRPRRAVSADLVFETAETLSVEIHPILVAPH